MSGTYRLATPSANAWDTTAAETALLQQLTRPGGHALTGYLAAAMQNGINNQDSYLGSLRATQQLQQQEAAAQREIEAMQARYKLAGDLAANPQSLHLTQPGQDIIAPTSRPLAHGFAVAGLDTTVAQSEQRRAEAERNRTAAGLDEGRSAATPEAVGRRISADATRDAATTSADARRDAARTAATGREATLEFREREFAERQRMNRHKEINDRVRGSGRVQFNAAGQPISRETFNAEWDRVAREMGYNEPSPMRDPAAPSMATQPAQSGGAAARQPAQTQSPPAGLAGRAEAEARIRAMGLAGVGRPLHTAHGWYVGLPDGSMRRL